MAYPYTREVKVRIRASVTCLNDRILPASLFKALDLTPSLHYLLHHLMNGKEDVTQGLIERLFNSAISCCVCNCNELREELLVKR